MARARLLAVVATVLVGAFGVISSTQTWLDATLDDGGGHTLAVPGADAVPVLAPLSLAVLALGAALSIVGRVLRWIFGALTVIIAVVLGLLTAQTAFAPPVSAVARAVTTATGITGLDSVAQLVIAIVPTPWPLLTFVAWLLLLGAGVFTLATAARWRGSGRRYQTGERAGAPARGPADAATAPARPRDAVDSWDDLSRGTDPTDGPR